LQKAGREPGRDGKRRIRRGVDDGVLRRRGEGVGAKKKKRPPHKGKGYVVDVM